MNWELIIGSYGYIALLVGTFLEGETILILAGFAAHLGYLHLPWVILVAFLGTLSGDQLFFYLGRRQSRFVLDKHPAWQRRLDRVERLFERYQTLLILGFRFLYGLRTVTPFVLGRSGVSPGYFFLLNTASLAERIPTELHNRIKIRPVIEFVDPGSLPKETRKTPIFEKKYDF